MMQHVFQPFSIYTLIWRFEGCRQSALRNAVKIILNFNGNQSNFPLTRRESWSRWSWKMLRKRFSKGLRFRLDWTTESICKWKWGHANNKLCAEWQGVGLPPWPLLHYCSPDFPPCLPAPDASFPFKEMLEMPMVQDIMGLFNLAGVIWPALKYGNRCLLYTSTHHSPVEVHKTPWSFPVLPKSNRKTRPSPEPFCFLVLNSPAHILCALCQWFPSLLLQIFSSSNTERIVC